MLLEPSPHVEGRWSVWFHYEDDTPTQWQEKGKLPIKLKGRGSLIMVSEEQGGYLALLD